jgi:hypothetical protein
MRRITIWLTVTLAAVAMAFYYQVGLSGEGKAGDHGPGDGPPITQTAPAATTPSATPASTTETTETPTTTGSDARVEPGSDSDHTDKPGESK